MVVRGIEKKRALLDLMPARWIPSRKLREYYERNGISSATVYRWLPRLVLAGLVEMHESDKGSGQGGTRTYYRKAPNLHYGRMTGAVSRKDGAITGIELEMLQRVGRSQWSNRQEKAYSELAIVSDLLAARIARAIAGESHKAGSLKKFLRSEDVVADMIRQTLKDVMAISYRYRNLKPGNISLLELMAAGYEDAVDDNSTKYLARYCPPWAQEYRNLLPPDVLAQIAILHRDSHGGIREIKSCLGQIEDGQIFE